MPLILERRHRWPAYTCMMRPGAMSGDYARPAVRAASTRYVSVRGLCVTGHLLDMQHIVLAGVMADAAMVDAAIEAD
eukprot:686407-Prymnesium_polylepis.1